MHPPASAGRGAGLTRGKLLSGISLLALAVPLAFLATPATAQESVANRELFGTRGGNDSGEEKSPRTRATPGTHAGDIVILNNTYSTTAEDTHGVGVRLGSIGGRGGKGYAHKLLAGAPRAGSAGGNGGSITLIQNGALAGRGDQEMGAALPADLKGLCGAVTADKSCVREQGTHGLLTQPVISYDYSRPIMWSSSFTYTEGYPDFKNVRDTRWDNRGGALLLLYSQGGDGGVSTYQSVTAPGGNAGPVTLTLNSAVESEGKNYSGVWVRSLGGNASPGTRRAGGAMDASTYKAGDGGVVSVTIGQNGSVKTDGASAPAIIAESLGGRGFDSRYLEDGSKPLGTDGGKGGTVMFRNAGSIETSGASSSGIIVQSAGGDAGGIVDLATKSGIFGGNHRGGNGGMGGDPIAINAGQVSTSGQYSFGLFVQSTGGSGGAGGSGVLSGGDGGAGGSGGNVRASNYGTITTKGDGAAGLIAQSVAGGKAVDAFQMKALVPGKSTSSGGAGGEAWFAGGHGGTGGAGGDISVVQAGTIKTDGAGAYGVVAQSIGGGGGNAGRADGLMPYFGLTLGGSGGSGGDGGEVRVQHSAYLSADYMIEDRNWALGLNPGQERPAPSITTTGSGAAGLVAMSVGGGGGVGGSAAARSVGAIASVSVGVGGDGGKGGKGGNVWVDNQSIIDTTGKEAPGILARSIGGGGGVAGDASAYALAVAPPEVPGVSFSFTVGGTGGSGGKGGDVSVYNYAPIITRISSSDGIDAMSVGGGGGDAGSAKSVSDIVGFYLNIPIAISLGGEGGGGGKGGDVTVTNWSSIETFGGFSRGISAISVGGGGGKGGTGEAKAGPGISWNDWADMAVGVLPTAESIAGQFTLGGKGGGGGGGGNVKVVNESQILTHGINAKGIHAQSIGGGGGDAGGFVSKGGGNAASVTLQFGGSGGDGGDGGTVNVGNTYKKGTIETQGNGSVGIFAQSVGGGGGDGGSFAGTVKAAPKFGDDPDKFILQLADELLKANDVASYVNGLVNKRDQELSKEFKKAVTDEDKQNIKKALSPLSKDSTTQEKLKQFKSYFKVLKFGIKGIESVGKSIETGKFSFEPVVMAAVGGTLELFKDSIKKAYKDFKFKEFDKFKVPSVDLSASLGGTGGKGGNGGFVWVTNDNTVITRGDTSVGIIAQSVGGGGGRGGAAVASGNNKLNVNLSVGGSGQTGGKGGTVGITNKGDVTTFGGASIGLFAQSVGGGGGIGGAASSANSISLHVDAKIGGSAGKSSDGGKVSVDNSGNITTSGKEAHAIVAQSVGGGGGTVFISRIDPDAPDVLANSQVTADALKEAEDLLKTIAGNTLNSKTATTEEKKNAKKIADLLAMNLVGPTGGGTGDVSSTILPTPSIGGSIGGNGGAGGNGGEVSVGHAGTIVTEGKGAMGIFAQSIGGGGGFGADAGSDGILARNLRIGGTGGTGGNGDTVTVSLYKDSKISTKGDGAHGVFLQSIGGGGGYAGVGSASGLQIQQTTQVTEKVWVYPPPIYVGGGMVIPSTPYQVDRTSTKGTSGNGGTIVVWAHGDSTITTTGKQAHGIFAQSLGAGGGTAYLEGAPTPPSVGNAPSRDAKYMKGEGGKITLGTRGTISATGEGAYGVFLQSGVQKTDATLDPSRLGKPIWLEHAGTITGGTGDGAAIRLGGGGTKEYEGNVIQINPDSVVSAGSQMAVIASFGRETINNHGTIKGDIDLVNGGSSEANYFANHERGIYESRTNGEGNIKLGVNGGFANRGTLSIAGDNQIGTLNITTGSSSGKALADLGGTMRVDVNSLAPGQKSDLLKVRGDVLLSGMQIRPHVIENLVPFADFTIIQADTIGSDVRIAATPGSPIKWDKSNSGTQVMLKAASADFTKAAGRPLTATEQALASSWQRNWDQSNANLSKLFGKLANVSSVEEYQQTLDSTSPEGQGQPAVSQTQNVFKSFTAAMSCPIFVDTGTMISESQCVWGRVTGSQAKLYDSWDVDGFTQNAVSMRVGGQWEIADNWFLGTTAAYTSTWGKSADRFTSFDGDSGDVSLALKYQTGAWLFAGSAHLGYGMNNITNSFDVAGARWQNTSHSAVWTGGLRARAAYEFAFTGWYLRPYVDVDLIYTHMGGYTVEGALFDMKVSDMSQWTVAVHPALEIGARVDLSDDTWLRPYFTAGLTYLSNDGLNTSVEIYDNVSNGVSFTSSSSMPDLLADLGAGLQFFAQNKYELRGEYRAQIGDQFLSHEGSLRLSTRF